MPKYVVNVMVSWQVFVSVAFDTAKGKGAKFENIDDGGDFLSQLSEPWEQDKEQLKQMTRAQVRNYLEDKIEA